MNLMKKLLLPALLVTSLVLVACDSGNGGSPSGTGNMPEVTYVEPTLPNPEGSDPFTGLTSVQSGEYEIIPDTTKRILTVKEKDLEIGKFKYTYTADGTITLHQTHMLWLNSEEEELLSAEEIVASLNTMTNIRKEPLLHYLSTTFDCEIVQEGGENILVYKGGSYNPELPLNRQTTGYFFGSKSIIVDFNVGCIEIFGTEYTMISVKDGKITCKNDDATEERTFTYTIKGTDDEPIVTVIIDEEHTVDCTWTNEGGSYNSELPLNDQTTGFFSGDKSIFIDFDVGYEYIEIFGTYYTIISVEDGKITCQNDDTKEQRTFNYTIKETDDEPIVTVTIDEEHTVDCTWNSNDGNTINVFSYTQFDMLS